MDNARKIICMLLLAIACAAVNSPSAHAQQRNDKLLNRPYADLRRWHLGFSVGINSMDLNFTHTGIVTESGESWFMEQPSVSPGFCVNGLFSLRLNNYFSVRLSPGMYFGNRVIKMRDANGETKEQQNIKSTMLVLPVDLKFASQRYHNVRPYLTTGAMAVYDVAKKRNREPLKISSTDFMLSVGFGCDFYLPYFKLCPEIKFCFGLNDLLEKKRPDLDDDPDRIKFTNALSKAKQQMIVLTFYFE
ncbi:MAG: PorT family protein [Muribaculum sp.]|nr:PorT family protein [Muribaculaceae bacterium]MCM1081616.1 PorT family protein [Muribaculum sp.]